MTEVRNVIQVRRRAMLRLERIVARCNRAARNITRALLATLPDQPTTRELFLFRDRTRLAMRVLAAQLNGLVNEEFRRLARLSYQDTRTLVERRYRRAQRARESRLIYEDPSFGLDFADLVLPAPDAELLRRIVGLAPARITRLGSGERVASTITQGIADGWDRRKISAEVERVFGATASNARRIVRTEGLRVATESQLAVSEQVAEVVTGYRISAVLDSRTRPDHRARHGTIYYRNPGPGRPGFGDMPRPPVEASGEIAHNCRCFLVPVFE